ncbi:MAG: TetR/AcrR family transcriptional regulator [Myxococcota bacterium]|jgi:AcrR family transcriptional regulator|nr:TetR/AcrR family transcriptional regulator [bacterium]MDP7298793.1 TetR/AcrR family transcriptional regulator [Myxococcota bacterium]MDP7432099.1 TetR/AcrR family transcriptional regulator [Myxococcota bacterium]MDP7572279.1 TetR/AcrR family transcriptional regulator [Myxococcota bacterium]HJO22061.1 TetR/AcrR family transcriptional regulator [Myxococcota bacterium]
MSTTDGRHARSKRTRAAVAEAMLNCLGAGVLRPSAKEVAEQANVSTRAVFRHFENMEALLEIASELQIERVMHDLPPLVHHGVLGKRIEALVSRTTRGYELAAPVRRATLLWVHDSKVVRDRHRWVRAQVRKQVRRVFRPELEALAKLHRRDRIEALSGLLSAAYWDELRTHQRLSEPTARRVLEETIRSLLVP